MDARVARQRQDDAESSMVALDGLPPLAFLCHPLHRGGVTRWMVDAALAWSRRGGSCWFVAPHLRGQLARSAQREEVVDLIRSEPGSSGVRVVTRSVGEGFLFGTHSNRVYQYAELLRSGVPLSVPVVLSDDEDVWSAGVRLGERNPAIGVLHSDETKYYDLARKHSAKLRALVAVSRRVAASAQPSAGRLQIAAIACGIPLAAPSFSRRASTATARLVWVGRIEERQKRVSDLVRIVAALHDCGAPVELHIIGDGPDRHALEQLARDRNVRHALTMHGWQSRHRVRELVEQCDLLILPSNFEGMPLAVMEALAAGVGVIASRTSGIEDVADSTLSAGCFWTYRAGDVAAAVESVKTALSVPLEERRRRATKFAGAEFDINRCVERYRDLLISLPNFTSRDSAPARWRVQLAACASYPLSLWRIRSLRSSAHNDHEQKNV